jgi:hypothetical protein
MSVRFDRRNESELQRQLRDLICLAVVGDHVRWVLTDDDGLRDWLVEAADRWRGWAEQVAARLVASEVAPDGRVRSLVKDIPLNWVPEGWLSGDDARSWIAERLALVAGSARYRHSQATGADADLLDLVATGLEAQLCVRQKSGKIRAKRERLSQNAAVRAERLRGDRSGIVWRR